MTGSLGHQRTGLYPAQPSQDRVVSRLCQVWGFLGSWVGALSVELGLSRSVQSVILFEPYKETGIPGLIQVGKLRLERERL